jgi:hypothetical protein
LRTWRAGKRPADITPEPKPHQADTRESAPASKESHLLELQRSAGNRAVQQLLPQSGESIPQPQAQKLGAAFGKDLSQVRIHHDAEAAELASEAGANAFTTGRDIYFAEGMYAPQTPDGEELLAHELTHVFQQESAGTEEDAVSHSQDAAEVEARNIASFVLTQDRVPGITVAGKGIQRDDTDRDKSAADPYGPLLGAFAKNFPDAAKLIATNQIAMKLVKEAETAGVKYGGFAEDGPSKDPWPYTVGDSVYIPKARTDKVVAASDFLFELNNAVRRPKFAALEAEAHKGKKSTLTAKDYARKNVELEVEGMLRAGEIWFDMKKQAPRGQNWDVYDKDFFLAQYKAFREGKATKDEIIDSVLKSKYTTGVDKGKTVGQFYEDQFKSLNSGS